MNRAEGEVKMKVLFVYDDIDDRQFFIDALSYVAPFVECILAKDCEQAFDFLQKTEDLPHYIFLDIHMPKLDGKHCLCKIKADAWLKNSKVVMYSTSSEQNLMEEYKSL